MFIDEKILNNKNLNANEKIILFLLMTNDQSELTSDYFIARLGCNQRTLDQGIHHLVKEGFLSMPGKKFDDESEVKKESKVMRNKVDYEKVKLPEFHLKDYESAVDELHGLIEEPKATQVNYKSISKLKKYKAYTKE